MKKLIVAILLFQFFAVHSQNADDYSIEKIVTINDKDTTIINELRLHRIKSALDTKRLLFKKFGKWHQEIRTDHEIHPMLLWKDVKLFNELDKSYTIVAYGVESVLETYSSVIIFDSKNNDLLDSSNKNRNLYVDYFFKEINTGLNNKEFNDSYWEMIYDYKKTLKNKKSFFKVTLTNGVVIEDDFKIRNSHLISKSTQKKIPYDSIFKYKYYGYGSPKEYYMIHMKKFKEMKNSKIAAGFRVYHGKKVDLFHAIFHSGLTPERSIDKYTQGVEVFVKRKDEIYAYSIGFMDGYGNYKTKKRLKDFFGDCPELIKKIENNEINELDTVRIVDFYENKCGE